MIDTPAWRIANGESRSLIAADASRHVQYRDSPFAIRHSIPK
jgi:hypothetical protein